MGILTPSRSPEAVSETAWAHSVLPAGAELQIARDVWRTCHNPRDSAEQARAENLGAYGMADFLVARAQTAERLSIGLWETEYCLAFGDAVFDVQQYFQFWRNHFARNIGPRLDVLRSDGQGSWSAGLLVNPDAYYDIEDFRRSAAFLYAGLTRALSGDEQRRLQELILRHDHAELVYKALHCWGQVTDTESLTRAFGAARRLLEFRRQFQAVLDQRLPWFAAAELTGADMTGMARTEAYATFTPRIMLPLRWHFAIDSDGVGDREQWHRLDWGKLQRWDQLRVDRPWEAQDVRDTDLAEGLRGYDGVGWYATSFEPQPDLVVDRIAQLCFGVTDDRVRVYFDGEQVFPTGQESLSQLRIVPAIPVTVLLRKGGNRHVIVVRVHDTGGSGGLRGRVWVGGPDPGDEGKDGG